MVFQQGIPRTPFAIVRQERMLSLELARRGRAGDSRGIPESRGAMVFQQGIPRTPFAIVRQKRMLSLELVSLELEWHPSTASSAARPLGQCHPPRSDAAVNL